MSIWARLFGAKNSHERDGVNAHDLLHNLDNAPLSVDKKTALCLPAFYAGLKVLGETVASLKVELQKVESNGDVNPAKDHYLYDIIYHEPNPLYSAFSWTEAGVMSGAATGNDYSYIKRDRNGRIEGLYLFKSENIYKWVSNGKVWYRDVVSNYTYAQDEVLHIPWMTFDGIHGLSAIEYHSTTIGQGLRGVEYGENVLRNGAFIQGVLSTDGELSNEAIKRLKAQWESSYGGSENSAKTPVLEQGLKFHPVRMKPSDIEFIKTMKYNTNDIAMILRVPLHLLQQLERSTNNNIEHQSIDFVVHTIRPIVKRREAEMNRKLLTPTERAEGYRIRYNIDSLLRGDHESRANLYKALHSMGAINADEIRRMEGMNMLPNGQGQKYYMMTNMADTNQISNDNEQ